MQENHQEIYVRMLQSTNADVFVSNEPDTTFTSQFVENAGIHVHLNSSLIVTLRPQVIINIFYLILKKSDL